MDARFDPAKPLFIFPEADGGFMLFSDARARFGAESSAEAEALAAAEEGWVVGGLSYPEAGQAAEGLWAVCAEPQRLDSAELSSMANPSPVYTSSLKPSLDLQLYRQAFEGIKEAEARGDCYQANLTFCLSGRALGALPWSPEAALRLWLELLQPGGNRAAGQGSQACFCLPGDGSIIASLSPELFFSLDGNRALARPMKGTAPRGSTEEEDAEQRRLLRESPKEKAENLMIADMLRNDLGKLALPGSVCVPALFETEALPSLWQMTSRVEAVLKPGTGLAELMEALHPCASITGAPKKRSREIIAEAEGWQRRWYTGSLGWYRPARRNEARKASFSVLIRTLVFPEATDPDFQLGVGGGIVWDGMAEEEYEEALLKASFLAPTRRRFCLTEAVLWEEPSGFFLMEAHERRLSASCEAWGGRLESGAFSKALEGAVAQAHDSGRRGSLKVRVLVDPDFRLSTEAQELSPTPATFSCAMSPRRLGPETLPLRVHKTTERAHYAGAREAGVDQMIFLNERGELTESTSMNILVEREGRLLTPSASSGLLRGTYRDWLLEKGEAEEAILYPEDLAKGRGFWLINSIRRRVGAVLHEVRGGSA